MLETLRKTPYAESQLLSLELEQRPECRADKSKEQYVSIQGPVTHAHHLILPLSFARIDRKSY